LVFSHWSILTPSNVDVKRTSFKASKAKAMPYILSCSRLGWMTDVEEWAESKCVSGLRVSPTKKWRRLRGGLLTSNWKRASLQEYHFDRTAWQN
jgi:hypothetical protein